jgi:hypothetical protein
MRLIIWQKEPGKCILQKFLKILYEIQEAFGKNLLKPVYQKFQAVNKWFIAVRKTFDKHTRPG